MTQIWIREVAGWETEVMAISFDTLFAVRLLSLSHFLLVPQMASGTTDDIPRREMGFSPHLPRRSTIFGPPMDKNNAVRKLDHSDQ